jgi:dihydrodiol dehydrogenase / D-xylose 1-dehydrogenase (NADP)
MHNKIRWLVLGCGGIARKFIADMAFVPDGVVAAVASRSIERAADFAAQYSITKHYGSYSEAAADPNIDAVYIATPHPMHLGDALMCIENGKAVLCEKPLTVNARQATEMIAAARDKKTFLMEAMWTRFVPATSRFIELIESGVIGDVRRADIDFGFFIDVPQSHRIFNPDLGGGALLDIGVYAASMASLIFKTQPQNITAAMSAADTGVDINDSICFDYGNGLLASIGLSCSSFMPIEAIVSGTKGYIKLCSPFYCSGRIEIHKDNTTTIYDIPVKGGGYCYQIQHVCQCIKEAKTQSKIMPLEESLQIIKTLDRTRALWNLRYPFEE